MTYYIALKIIFGGVIFFYFVRGNKNQNSSFEELESLKTNNFKNSKKIFLEENLEGMSRRIGKMNHYYIKSFYSNKKFVFNFGGFFGVYFWLGYRGMFRELLIFLLFLSVGDYVFFKLNLNINFGIFFSLIFGFFGNHLYFNSLYRRIKGNIPETNKILGLFLSIALLFFYTWLSGILQNIYT